MNVAIDAYTPVQTTQRVLVASAAKAAQPYQNVVLRNFYGGALLGMGCMFSILITGGATEITKDDPGVTKVLAAFVFPVGLIFIILTGAELLTGNIMYMGFLLLERKITIPALLINWTLSWIGNLAGSLWFAGIFCFYGAIATAEPYKTGTIGIVEKKILDPDWGQIFIRAMGCNWLVALACWLAASSRDNISKVVVIHLPIWTFVSLGFEHIVADMFFIPLGMMNGAPLGVGKFIWKGLIPITLGNIVGGGVFVTGAYWYLDIFSYRNTDADVRQGAAVIDAENGSVSKKVEENEIRTRTPVQGG